MLHARSDYDPIQDPRGLIPEDEPVFLIRGKDLCAPSTIVAWADLARAAGADAKIIEAALGQAQRMIIYQASTGCSQIPDMPE